MLRSSPQQQQQQQEMRPPMVCRMCHHGGSDVRLVGCGCTMHARCVPLSLIVRSLSPGEADRNSADGESSCSIPGAMNEGNLSCPMCGSGAVSGMYLFPMSFAELDKAVELRKNFARAAAQAVPVCNKGVSGAKRKRDAAMDEDFHEIQAESSYLLLSQSRSSSSTALFPDADHHRTGRWTSEEVSFVDFIVTSFDQGLLPVPHGIKLNEFLGEMLLCKSSRLTKKMKNAKLSTRSYELRSPVQGAAGLDCPLLSRLEQNFLSSLGSEPTRLELVFNITKLWRTHFSNLCLQVGYQKLDAQDWMSSLEKMESRAAEAETFIRKARRRRMGLALKKDVAAPAVPTPGVFLAGLPAETAQQQRNEEREQSAELSVSNSALPNVTPSTHLDRNANSNSYSNGSAACQFVSNILDVGSNQNQSQSQSLSQARNRLMSDDFSLNMEELVECLGPLPHSNSVTSLSEAINSSSATSSSRGPFLDEIMSYIEDRNLPFQHADVWVPSFVQNSENGDTGAAVDPKSSLRLLNAGYASRRDLPTPLYLQLHEFGEYSSKFSFAPGVGLPGRVFLAGRPSWERRVDEGNPQLSERAGGAKVYGIKTAMGVPLSTGIGQVIVVFYSMHDVPEDTNLISKCIKDLSVYAPEPRWQLVIDTGARSNVLIEGNSMIQQNNAATTSSENRVAVETGSAFQKIVPQSNTTGATNFNSLLMNSKSQRQQQQMQLERQQRQQQTSGGFPRSSGMPPSTSSSSLLESALSIESSSVITSPDHQQRMSPRSTSSSSSTQRDNELQIATLLGDYMPVASSGASTNAGEPSSSLAASSDLLNQFMSLRLLLLRTPERRSTEDNELIEVLTKSFTGYSKDNRRSGAELATLLAKDWKFLKMTSSGPNSMTAPPPVPKPKMNQMAATRRNTPPTTAPGPSPGTNLNPFSTSTNASGTSYGVMKMAPPPAGGFNGNNSTANSVGTNGTTMTNQQQQLLQQQNFSLDALCRSQSSLNQGIGGGQVPHRRSSCPSNTATLTAEPVISLSSSNNVNIVDAEN